MTIQTLGEPRFTSPYTHPVDDSLRLPLDVLRPAKTASGVSSETPSEVFSGGAREFELAGPRARLLFDPVATRAGIVTCGGLCPGLNNVIRSIVLELHHKYGVRDVLGFRNGYQGLDPAVGQPPVVLNPEEVEGIHRDGGTILGTSRGPVDVAAAVENLIRLKIEILFTIGGDGTQRGANALFQAARKRGHRLAVVGVPKTIDNDVAFVARSFGFQTAVEQAQKVLDCAHTEARSVPNGVALVKLMGRHAGFIAAGAVVASQDVNFCLVPEVPFRLEGDRGLLSALKRRLQARSHAVIVVAEGAGQDLLDNTAGDVDASGNVKLKDIGLFLREAISRYFTSERIGIVVRYFDPSYSIRSVAADAEDAILCDLFARHAVHAAMAGKTGLVIGLLHDHFIHVPIEALVGEKKCLDRGGMAWQAVLSATGQPARFE
jgi:6-phosphofructokinase 1